VSLGINQLGKEILGRLGIPFAEKGNSLPIGQCRVIRGIQGSDQEQGFIKPATGDKKGGQPPRKVSLLDRILFLLNLGAQQGGRNLREMLKGSRFGQITGGVGSAFLGNQPLIRKTYRCKTRRNQDPV